MSLRLGSEGGSCGVNKHVQEGWLEIMRRLESWVPWARLGSESGSRRVYKHVQEWGGWLEMMRRLES